MSNDNLIPLKRRHLLKAFVTYDFLNNEINFIQEMYCDLCEQGVANSKKHEQNLEHIFRELYRIDRKYFNAPYNYVKLKCKSDSMKEELIVNKQREIFNLNIINKTDKTIYFNLLELIPNKNISIQKSIPSLIQGNQKTKIQIEVTCGKQTLLLYPILLLLKRSNDQESPAKMALKDLVFRAQAPSIDDIIQTAAYRPATKVYLLEDAQTVVQDISRIDTRLNRPPFDSSYPEECLTKENDEIVLDSRLHVIENQKTKEISNKIEQDKLKFSQHALIRKEQRKITDSSVNAVIYGGTQIDCKNTTVYTDENTKVVLSSDSGSIITVNKNTRNTRFQLFERTHQKEKSLIYAVNVKKSDHAMCELGELYLNGELGKKEIKKAYNLFQLAAEKGNSHAMCKLSQLYESGDLGKPNQELADKWMKKAADKNNVYALAYTGQKLLLKYQEKYPVKSNVFRPSAPKKEILYYLNKAADKGSTRAIWQLGDIYKNGYLGEQDLSKAIEFYVKAAKMGSPASLESLYILTLKCNFSVKELEEILDNVSSLLNFTSIGMAFQIGEEQLIGNLGYNPVRGLKMIEQAALKQYDKAILKLAKCYRDGEICDVNLKIAQYWFFKLHEMYDVSSKNGNVISLWKLGGLYLKGNVGNIDLKKAESCFKEAIEKSSDPDWIYDLGILYLNGRLGDKPIHIGIELIAQAIKIWQLQASKGDTETYFDIGDAYLSIYSHKNAVYWLSKTPSDNIDAQLCLAEIYLDNSSSEKNILLGLNTLKNIILEHGINPSVAFKEVKFTIDNQTVSWFQDIADNVQELIPNTNQQTFEKFVVSTLAKIYETGQLGKIDYILAFKYYHQLFINFKSIIAGNKLVWFCSNQHLPEEYHDIAKKWALKIPALLENNDIDFETFIDCVLLLSKIYQTNDIVPCDFKEAAKWLYLASYFNMPDNAPKMKDIKQDLANLPQLDLNQKEQIVSELVTITQKITSLLIYKIMSRILGDIFYDNKIINQDIDKAIYWYTESALKNNGLASFTLGKIYQNKGDLETSIRWYKLSVQKGNKRALKELTDIYNEKKVENLSLFLNKYQYQSLVQESELMNISPLKNLESYPKTLKEMYELGKSYLDLKDKQDTNVLNAAFWFRKAMKHGNIDAAIELHSMYHSGILGINLIPVADNLCLDILNKCYFKLKRETLVQTQNTSSILSLLNNVSSVLKTRKNTFLSTLQQNIENILNQTHNINTATLKDVVSDLELLKLKLCSDLEYKISNALDNISLSEVRNASTS